MSSVLTEQSERGAPIEILHIQVGTTLDSVQEEDSGEHMLVGSVHNEDLSSKNADTGSGWGHWFRTPVTYHQI